MISRKYYIMANIMSRNYQLSTSALKIQLTKVRILVMFAVIVFLYLPTAAQKWAAVGDKWTFTKGEPFTGESWPNEWKVIDTITMKGKLCTIIQSTAQPFEISNKFNYTMITYEDSDIVYWYRPLLKDFTVLYDFNKKVGESWEIDGLQAALSSSGDTNYCSIKMTVKEVGVDTINGVPLKTMLATSYPLSYQFGGKIIQNIGSLMNIRPNPSFICKPVSENFDQGFLRCFESNFIGFHDFKIVPDCNYRTTSIDALKKENIILIFPNPVKDLLTLKISESGNISVMNLYGQTVFLDKVKAGTIININTHSWNEGLYLYRFESENHAVFYGKILKQ